MRTPARLAALGIATSLSLTLAACGGNDSASSPASTTSSSASSSSSASASVDAQHNAADVSFAQNMIVHHKGAIEMAQMATTQASSQQVKDLASRIEAAQGPEIEEMTSWLTAWGAPLTADGSMSGMSSSGSMSSGSMPGMDSSGSTGSGSMGMTDEQMTQLKAATGTDFDRMFLQMMITHHTSAIDMAKAEQTDGSNPQAIALAKSIETSQTAEVAEMNQMLGSLGS